MCVVRSAEAKGEREEKSETEEGKRKCLPSSERRYNAHIIAENVRMSRRIHDLRHRNSPVNAFISRSDHAHRRKRGERVNKKWCVIGSRFCWFNYKFTLARLGRESLGTFSELRSNHYFIQVESIWNYGRTSAHELRWKKLHISTFEHSQLHHCKQTSSCSSVICEKKPVRNDIRTRIIPLFTLHRGFSPPSATRQSEHLVCSFWSIFPIFGCFRA